MDMLDLKGCVITADALNCQRTVAANAMEKSQLSSGIEE